MPLNLVTEHGKTCDLCISGKPWLIEKGLEATRLFSNIKFFVVIFRYGDYTNRGRPSTITDLPQCFQCYHVPIMLFVCPGFDELINTLHLCCGRSMDKEL